MNDQFIPSPGDLPDPGIEPRPPAWQEDSLPTELPRKLHLTSDLFSNLFIFVFKTYPESDHFSPLWTTLLSLHTWFAAVSRSESSDRLCSLFVVVPSLSYVSFFATP